MKNSLVYTTFFFSLCYNLSINLKYNYYLLLLLYGYIYIFLLMLLACLARCRRCVESLWRIRNKDFLVCILIWWKILFYHYKKSSKNIYNSFTINTHVFIHGIRRKRKLLSLMKNKSLIHKYSYTPIKLCIIIRDFLHFHYSNSSFKGIFSFFYLTFYLLLILTFSKPHAHLLPPPSPYSLLLAFFNPGNFHFILRAH